jgi:hypothetical protein
LALVLVFILALPATAGAAKVKLDGAVVGQPDSRAQITVRKRHHKLRQVTKLAFSKVDVSCQDGTAGQISGHVTRSFAIRGKDFTRKSRLDAIGIDNGYFKATGRFRGGGKSVSGKVRFAFKLSSNGTGCGTGEVRWKASKR